MSKDFDKPDDYLGKCELCGADCCLDDGHMTDADDVMVCAKCCAMERGPREP